MRFTALKREKNDSGVTVVELLVALAILAIITGIAVSSFGGFRRQKVLDNSAGEVASLLREARALTLASRDGAAWGVHFETSNVTLFRAPTFASGAANNKAVTLDAAVTLATTSITGGGSDIIFKKLSGETNNVATTTLSRTDDPTIARIVTVSTTGIIHTQ